MKPPIPSVPADIRTARLILNALPNLGPVSCRRLCEEFGSVGGIFRASREQLLRVKGVGSVLADTLIRWREHFDPAREMEKMTSAGVTFAIPEDADVYPPLLLEIYDPPQGLYCTAPFKWGSKCVAIVGTRRVSSYGKMMARLLGRGLAAAGWCVVSGMARGVDTAAHLGALEAGGPTVAVLGCGADIAYPPENKNLMRDITSAGAVISEFPLGRNADKQTFPMRNRIISGISRAVVVVESDEKGGGMITARFAGEHGRIVCAVPGRADTAYSRGCHALIRDGATLVTCVDEVLEELGGGRNVSAQTEMDFGNGAGAAAVPMSELEKKVLECLSGGVRFSVDSIAEQTGESVASLSGTLLMMELSRLVEKMPDGGYEAAGFTRRAG
ncbi:MAG: DNA-processing protein DprA [Puniceicoccales bacterium]|jgi:DNA processing protein|nr:DNA-processing protein DprA [Puniceicoccales bacterium]